MRRHAVVLACLPLLAAAPPRSAAAASALADDLDALSQLLSRADAFVGTAASWTSRLVLLAIAGEIAAVPPFAMVDKPLGQLWFA